jgi:hypothetical protein
VLLCGSRNLTPDLPNTVVSTVRSLPSSGRHGQATVYLFQKHLIFWECTSTLSIAMELLLLRLNFILLEFFVKKIELLQTNCAVLRVTRQYFWNGQKTFGAACDVSPLTSLLPHPRAKRDQRYMSNTVHLATCTTLVTRLFGISLYEICYSFHLRVKQKYDVSCLKVYGTERTAVLQHATQRSSANITRGHANRAHNNHVTPSIHFFMQISVTTLM